MRSDKLSSGCVTLSARGAVLSTPFQTLWSWISERVVGPWSRGGIQPTPHSLGAALPRPELTEAVPDSAHTACPEGLSGNFAYFHPHVLLSEKLTELLPRLSPIPLILSLYLISQQKIPGFPVRMFVLLSFLCRTPSNMCQILERCK